LHADPGFLPQVMGPDRLIAARRCPLTIRARGGSQ
jgi:hypothetical protein